jgi:hypothetical protein
MSLIRRSSPGSRRSRLLAVATTAAACAAIGASAASAAGPTGIYSDFGACPLATHPELASCLYSTSTGGSFKLGNATVPINKTIVLQGGVNQDPVTGATSFVDATGGNSLPPVALDVPGGLSGLISSSQLSGAALFLYQHTIATANDISATAEQVGPIGFDFDNYFNGSGVAIKLPIRVHLQNPFLGSSCYVGSAAHPITLNLTSGTTSPPAPNTPISGSPGTFYFQDNGNLVIAQGNKLVDNAFSVPGASGCGGIFSLLIDPLVNLKEGFPSAAGKNSATLTGSTKLAVADAVRASIH